MLVPQASRVSWASWEKLFFSPVKFYSWHQIFQLSDTGVRLSKHSRRWICYMQGHPIFFHVHCDLQYAYLMNTYSKKINFFVCISILYSIANIFDTVFQFLGHTFFVGSILFRKVWMETHIWQGMFQVVTYVSWTGGLLWLRGCEHSWYTF